MKIAIALVFAALLAGCPDNTKPGATPAASGTGASTAAPSASASAGSGSGW